MLTQELPDHVPVAKPVLYWRVDVQSVVVLMVDTESNPVDPSTSLSFPLHHLIRAGDRLFAVFDLPESCLTRLSPGSTSKAALQGQHTALMEVLPWCAWRTVDEIAVSTAPGGRRAAAPHTFSHKAGVGFSRVTLELHNHLSSPTIEEACAIMQQPSAKFSEQGRDPPTMAEETFWPLAMGPFKPWPETREDAEVTQLDVLIPGPPRHSGVCPLGKPVDLLYECRYPP